MTDSTSQGSQASQNSQGHQVWDRPSAIAAAHRAGFAGQWWTMGPEELAHLLNVALPVRPDERIKADDSLVLRITTAYEQGFGHALRTELSNPYLAGSPEAEAWDTGREEGARRATPDQRLLELLRKSLDFDGYGHWLPDICVRVAKNPDDETPPTFDEFVKALYERLSEKTR